MALCFFLSDLSRADSVSGTTAYDDTSAPGFVTVAGPLSACFNAVATPPVFLDVPGSFNPRAELLVVYCDADTGQMRLRLDLAFVTNGPFGETTYDLPVASLTSCNPVAFDSGVLTLVTPGPYNPLPRVSDPPVTFTVRVRITEGACPGVAAPAVIDATPDLPAPTVKTGAVVQVDAPAAPVVDLPAPTVLTGAANGATAAPAVIDLAASLPGPTITTGAKAVPVVIDLAPTLPAPAVVVNTAAVAAPAVIDLTPTLPAPTVAGTTAVGVAVLGLLAPTLPAPTVTGGAKATPAVLDSTPDLPAPVIAAGAAVVASPDVIDIPRVLVPPAVVKAGAKVQPAVIDLTPSLPVPTVTGAVQVSCCAGGDLRRSLPAVVQSADCPCADTADTLTWDDALPGWAVTYTACGHTLRLEILCDATIGDWDVRVYVDGVLVPTSAGFLTAICAVSRRPHATWQVEIAIPDALTGAGNTCHLYLSAG